MGGLESGGATPVVEPRDAATVLMVRPGADGGAEAYALRRPDSFRTFAGVWAFPGGTTTSEDRLPDWGELLRPLDVAGATAVAVERERVLPAIQTHRFWREKAEMLVEFLGRLPDDPVPDAAADPATNLAVWVTAVRELFEETGVLLAERAGTARGTAPPPATELADRRRLVLSGDLRFIDCLRGSGLRPALGSLRYMGRLCTPSFRPYRFDTRFFLARVPAGTVADGRRVASTEVAEEGWFRPADLLRQNDHGDLPLMPPTRYVIELAAAHADIEDLWGAFAAGAGPGG